MSFSDWITMPAPSLEDASVLKYFGFLLSRAMLIGAIFCLSVLFWFCFGLILNTFLLPGPIAFVIGMAGWGATLICGLMTIFKITDVIDDRKHSRRSYR